MFPNVRLHGLHFRSPSGSLVVTDLLLPAFRNVRLCRTMDVSGQLALSTRLMMMSHFGWQCSETSLCKCGFPPGCAVWMWNWFFFPLCIDRGLKGLVAFLAEQPRQLKHLEWPGLQNTVCPLHWTLLRCLENFHDTLLDTVILCQY